jgi:hypothetical protein
MLNGSYNGQWRSSSKPYSTVLGYSRTESTAQYVVVYVLGCQVERMAKEHWVVIAHNAAYTAAYKAEQLMPPPFSS